MWHFLCVVLIIFRTPFRRTQMKKYADTLQNTTVNIVPADMMTSNVRRLRLGRKRPSHVCTAHAPITKSAHPTQKVSIAGPCIFTRVCVCTTTFLYLQVHTGHVAVGKFFSIATKQAPCMCRSTQPQSERHGTGTVSVQMKHSGGSTGVGGGGSGTVGDSGGDARGPISTHSAHIDMCGL